MAEHTPGPWTVSDTHPSDGWMGWNVKGGRAYICAVVDGCQSVDENYANACLIAAAPDLLAACETAKRFLLDCMDDSVDPGETIEDVIAALCAAIAKAREETAG